MERGREAHAFSRRWCLGNGEHGLGRASRHQHFRFLINQQRSYRLAFPFPPSLWGVGTQALTTAARELLLCLGPACEWLSPFPPFAGGLFLSDLDGTASCDRISAMYTHYRVSFFWALLTLPLKPGHYSGSSYPVTHLHAWKQRGNSSGQAADASGFPHSLESCLSSPALHLELRTLDTLLQEPSKLPGWEPLPLARLRNL